MKMRNFMFKKNYKGDGTLLQGGAYILKVDHKGNKQNRYIRRGPTDKTRICRTEKIEKLRTGIGAQSITGLRNDFILRR
jgi:hypothetical protein